ncbi:hypothetical protein [Caloramator quimbayensis]|uniref:hypothetical protein n=1 Tax=Caloramator quimbayensis TaxID=1147123 RepID=UPI001177C332|nr:hypothetical protein [Caloramator quimbayensis]
MRLTKKDDRDSVGNAVRLEAKVDYISKGVDDIRLDIKDHGRKIDDIDRRVTRVEESTKSAHHRIDELINKEGE